jgi:hypothetical protein
MALQWKKTSAALSGLPINGAMSPKPRELL